MEYEIRDPVEAGNMGINTGDLYDETANELWTNKEYQVLISAYMSILTEYEDTYRQTIVIPIGSDIRCIFI